MGTANATRAEAHVPKNKCQDSAAPRLCAIHKHVHRINHARHTMGLGKVKYDHLPEAQPNRRGYWLWYWARVDRRTHDRLQIGRAHV